MYSDKYAIIPPLFRIAAFCMTYINAIIVRMCKALGLGFLVWGTSSYASVEQHFQTLQANPSALYDFLKAMPKGGELHYHFDGSVYAETMLYLSKQTHVCLDSESMASEFCTLESPGITILDVLKHPALFDKTVHAWSMKDFSPHTESAYEHFHSIFSKLFIIQSQIQAPLLAAVLKKAAEQHELYLEIMMFGLPDNQPFSRDIAGAKTFDDKRQRLLANQAFQRYVDRLVTQSQELLPAAHTLLHCATNPKQDACKIQVNYQYYVRRTRFNDTVFADALVGFVAAERSHSIVAVNLVGGEDDPVAQHDYDQQMHIFNTLHTLYPKVHIALHAGELFPKAVVSHSVQSPIRDAIVIGQAERIGHGIDIREEPHPEQLAALMADKGIAVEANLTSNRLLFNIAGAQHPLSYYLKHHVPVVLSTDDEGILRTELTNEYFDAVAHYHLDYATLKNIDRNTLTYAFLPGQSLWLNPRLDIPVKACQSLDSSSCLHFIQSSPKAKLQWQLEQDFKVFEKQYK